jgi:hypothetical protein
MRFLMHFKIPHEPFNKLVRDGVVGAKLGRIVEQTRPEHIYFMEQDGYRSGIAIYEIKETAKFCAVAEPWFLALNAECKFSVAMTPEDLGKVDFAELGKSWT